MVFSIFMCFVGFIILSYAADKLVDGASSIALNFGVSKTVIGLTIVAAGTSLPEMVVSVNASIKGNPALSLGNLVGSNIMNIALILGIASLICPIECNRQIVRREVPIMIGASLMLWYMAYTGKVISTTEGVLMLCMFVAYTALNYYLSRKEASNTAEVVNSANEVALDKEESRSTITNLLYIAGSLVGLVIGSEILVKGAVFIAQTIGLSDEIIGLTLIAIGTSLPELATSISAARKNQSEIVLGNVIGSNIFNILGIVGCSCIASYFYADPASKMLLVSDSMLGTHIPLMVIVSLAVLPIMITGMRIVKAEGIFLIALYIVYNIILFSTVSTVPKEMKTGNGAAIEQQIKPGTASDTKNIIVLPTETTQIPESVSAGVIISATETFKQIASDTIEKLIPTAGLATSATATP